MRIRLLICDDDKLMVELLSGLMQPMASYIDSADNLHDALELAKTGQFNLVLLDLRFPKTGKEEAFHSIREFKSHCAAVVVVSGLPDPHLKEDALAAGADGVVSKDGSALTRALLLAANAAVLHLPRESFRSESFTEHIGILERMAHA